MRNEIGMTNQEKIMAVKLEIVRKLVGAKQDISVTSPAKECNLARPCDLPMDWRVEFEERAAILQYEGGLSRNQADKQAFAEILNRIREGRLSR